MSQPDAKNVRRRLASSGEGERSVIASGVRGEGGRALPLRLPHLPARIRSCRSICFSAIAVWVNRLATRLGSLGTTLGLA